MGVGIPSTSLMVNCARRTPALFEFVGSLMGRWRRRYRIHQISVPNPLRFLLPGFVREVLNTEPAVLMPWLRQASPQPPSAPLRGLVRRVEFVDYKQSVQTVTSDSCVAGGQ